VVCDDYDLCESCEVAGRHPGHNTIKGVGTTLASAVQEDAGASGQSQEQAGEAGEDKRVC